MISKASLHFFKSQVRNYFKLITLNGKTYEVPPNFREPVYDMEKLQNSSNVILMRHGNTLFNLSYDQIFFEKGYGNEILDLWHDDIFRDSPLSDFGIEQCKHTAQFAEQFDIDMVLISPMRRTLQTAHYLLRNHPQKDEIKYVVHPGIREHVYGYCEMTRNWGDKYIIENEYETNIVPFVLMYKKGIFQIKTKLSELK